MHKQDNNDNNNAIYKAPKGIGFIGAGGRSVAGVNQKLYGKSTS